MLFPADGEMPMRYDLWMKGKSAPKKYSKAAGFSMIELVVTLALLTIVLLIAIPNFHRISANGNLKTAARDLIADFNTVRERAIAENRQFTFTFNGNNTYTYSAPASGGNPALNQTKSPANIAPDIAFSNLTFGGAGGSVTLFSARGTLTPSGSVQLNNARGSTAIISCNVSGRVSVSFNWQ